MLVGLKVKKTKETSLDNFETNLVFLVLSVLASVATLHASPLFGLPIQNPMAIVNGLGNALNNGIRVGQKVVGTGMGLGSAALGHVLAQGGGLGASRQGSGFVNSDNFAGDNYNDGASGGAGSKSHNIGGNNFHNVGQHHSKVTKVTSVENNDSHNIGGSNFHDQGAQANSQFNKNQNSAAAHGNSLTKAGQGSSNIGLGGLGGAAQQGSNYLDSQNFANQNQGSSAGGASGQSAHNVGGGGFHNVGQHHNKITSVTTSEDEGSHNVGGSNFHNIGAQAQNQFNKGHHGASSAGNSLTSAGQGSQVVGNPVGNGLGLGIGLGNGVGYDAPLMREADEIGIGNGLAANAAANAIGNGIARGPLGDNAAAGANAVGNGIATAAALGADAAYKGANPIESGIATGAGLGGNSAAAGANAIGSGIATGAALGSNLNGNGIANGAALGTDAAVAGANAIGNGIPTRAALGADAAAASATAIGNGLPTGAAAGANAAVAGANAIGNGIAPGVALGANAGANGIGNGIATATAGANIIENGPAGAANALGNSLLGGQTWEDQTGLQDRMLSLTV
ncbi:unnamed protein product [Pieris brassicae]|uniref:Uncharacterized protein n=1 Tax=Pieris brassicae TaxID=7116 RepID=A0A9P0XHJ6_PIEBR|nr:unnamed protein product [Pieris brassicae]